MTEFFILLAVLVAVAVFLRVDFVFYIIYLCLGLFVASRFYFPVIFKRLQVTRRLNRNAFLGEVVPVQIVVENGTRWPLPFLTVEEAVPAALRRSETLTFAASIRGKQQQSFDYELRARRRGFYRLGPMRIQSGDIFGFTQLSRQGGAGYLTVYPKILPISRLNLPSRLPFGTLASRQRLFEDPARPRGVREYRSGDPQRTINWKASAHTRDLLVKTFQPAISLESMVVLDLYRPNYSQHNWRESAEWAISVAASVAAHLSAQRQPVGLLTNGLDPIADNSAPLFEEKSGQLQVDERNAAARMAVPIPSKGGRANLMKVLETLARVEAAETEPPDSWAMRHTVGLSWGVTLIVVTPRGDEMMCQLLHRFLRAGYNPVLLVIRPTNRFPEVRERARRLGFSAYHVLQPTDLELEAR